MSQDTALENEFAKDTLERLQEESAVLREQLRMGVTAQNAASQKYIDAVKEQHANKTAIDELRVHVKQNILYYMQAIWSYEYQDKIYFRLFDLDVHVGFEPKRNDLFTCYVDLGST